MKIKLFSRKKSKNKLNEPFMQKRVLIFGLGRSGSTLLEDLLQSTGHFKAHGELFNPSEPIYDDPVQFYIDKATQCHNQHFISHIKVYEMASVIQSGMSKREFLDHLIEQGWQIVYLTRTNKIKHTLSSYRAHESSIFHTNEILPIKNFTIDCFKFKHSVGQFFKWESEEKQILNGLPYMKVEYELHLENQESHQSTINAILNYLELPLRTVSTKHKKVIRGELETIIANYAEFAEEMRTAGYGEYL
jgi:hypothetical protein